MRIITNEELLIVAGGTDDAGEDVGESLEDSPDGSGKKPKNKEAGSSPGTSSGSSGSKEEPQKTTVEAILALMPSAKLECTVDIKGKGAEVDNWEIKCKGEVKTRGSK